MIKWLSILICLIMAACSVAIKESNTEARGEKSQTELISEDLPTGLISPAQAPELGIFRGKPFVVRYNSKGELAYSWDNEEQIISDAGAPGAKLSYIGAYADEHGIYLFWRAKLSSNIKDIGIGGDKIIYFRSSTDGRIFGKTHRLNTKGGAFNPKVAMNGMGDLYAAWVDERIAEEGYGIFMNLSHDYGQKWKDEDIRIDQGEAGIGNSLDPDIAVEGNNVWIAWNEVVGSIRRPAGGGARAATDGARGKRSDSARGSASGVTTNSLYVKKSSNNGEQWKEPVLISEEVESPTALALVKKDNRLILYWFNRIEFKLAYSDDAGSTWKIITPAGFENIAELKVFKSENRIYVLTGILPNGKNEDIFVYSTEDGINFENAMRLDTNTPHLTTSTVPMAAADNSGNIFIAWQDMRNFRPNVYFNYSADKGLTWLSKDRSIEEDGIKIYSYPRAIADEKGGFYLSWIGYTNDKYENSKLYLSRIDSKSSPVTRHLDRDENKLRQRVSQFWEDRKKANWGGNYDLLDPMIRKDNSREYYIASQFKAIYSDYEIKDITITENRAKVKLKYTVEIPEFYSPKSGKKLSVPKREEEIIEEWAWIDDNWFRIFVDTMGGTLMKQ